MRKQSLPFPIALMLFLVSALLLYSVFYSHGWPVTDFNSVWRGLTPVWRGVAFVCFVGNAWGLGAMINAALRRGKQN